VVGVAFSRLRDSTSQSGMRFMEISRPSNAPKICAFTLEFPYKAKLSLWEAFADDEVLGAGP
jgi:hypothetical protein